MQLSNFTTAANMRKRKALFVTYQFPPVGGAGVQRISKFIKYMPSFNWTPSVLTVANPSVPVFDESLLKDLPSNLHVCKSRTLEPSYQYKTSDNPIKTNNTLCSIVLSKIKQLLRRLASVVLVPDPQILWYNSAVAAGEKLLCKHPHSAIIASGPPFSTFLVGFALSQQSKLPLVLDYRDEWNLCEKYSENKRVGSAIQAINMRLQGMVMRNAKLIIATTKASASAIDKIRKKVGSTANVTWLYNGFDATDFLSVSSVTTAVLKKYIFAYTGTLWNMTSCQPVFRAIEILKRHQPEIVKQLAILFAGRKTVDQQNIVDSFHSLDCEVIDYSYIRHDKALELAHSSNANLLIVSDLPGAERVVPAKLFECLRTRRPLLAIAPKGEVWQILNRYPLAHLVEPKNTDGIARAISEMFLTRCQNNNKYQHQDEECFERKNQTGQLVEMLNSL